MSYAINGPSPSTTPDATNKRRERDARRTRLTVEFVKTLLIAVRPSLAEVLKGVKTVPALKAKLDAFTQITPQPLDRPPLDTAKTYAVVLTHISPQVIGAIKLIRDVKAGMFLIDAKNLVDRVRDGLDQTLFTSAGFDECNNLFDRFNAIGCKLAFVEVV